MSIINVHILEVLHYDHQWPTFFVLLEHVKGILPINLINHEGHEGSSLNVSYI